MSVSYIPRLRPRLSSTPPLNSPSKLALLSHHKLQEESSAEEPDLRRCLGHNAVLSKTMTATRRDVNRYRRSSRFCEDDGVDGYISRKEDQGSVIRAQIAKAVRGMVRRRSIAATTTTTTATTTTTHDDALARVAANNNRDTGNKWNTFSSLVSIKRRECVARLVSGRKFWAQPVLIQASAG